MRQLDIHVVRFDGSSEEAIQGLESEFGLNHDAAVRFVRSVPRIARSGTAPQEAHAYQQVLSALGAVVELRPTRSLPMPADATIPSLPRPPVMKPAQDPAYDSSASLAQRVPRAPAVPLEAWNRRPQGGFDELGNALPNDVASEPELILRSWHDGLSNTGSSAIAHTSGTDDAANRAWASLPDTAERQATGDAMRGEVAARVSQRGLWFGIALLLVGVVGGLYVRWQASSKAPTEAVEAH